MLTLSIYLAPITCRNGAIKSFCVGQTDFEFRNPVVAGPLELDVEYAISR